MPSNIGTLKNLQTLNISGNNLKELPSSISGLASLKTLDISNNQKLVKLPKELGHLHSLGKHQIRALQTFIYFFILAIREPSAGHRCCHVSGQRHYRGWHRSHHEVFLLR